MEQTATAILIADDEPALLSIMTIYLRRLGHSVVGFETARDAWDHFRAQPDAFALFISDATLRDAEGESLLARMRELNPGLALLICSGYPVDLATLPPDLRRRTAFLQKPFTPKMLSDTVKRLLQGGP
jgi:DNA-binding NtrC family response regulator